MKAFFKEIFEFTYTFNNKVIEALMANDSAQKAVLLISHTVNSQEIWNARIENIQIERDVWGIRPLDELRITNEANYKKSLYLIENCNFEEKIRYINIKGIAFENSVRDILFHVVNHSTYHRGQIATDFKLNDITPLVTDYIFYKRNEI
jgi:uncharacterized damage-inducible protein DinB